MKPYTNKLFNFVQTKGKQHKFSSFDLGKGAKLYRNFAQKLLAVSLCMAVVLLGTPVTTFALALTGARLSVSASVLGKKATIKYTLTAKGNPLVGKEVSVPVEGPGDFSKVEATAHTEGDGIAVIYPTFGPAGSYTVFAAFVVDDANPMKMLT